MLSAVDIEKQKLIEISIALASETDLPTLLKKIMQELRLITQADGGSLCLKENHNLRFEIAQNDTLLHSKGEDYQFFKPFEIPISKRSIAGYVALTGEALNILDALCTLMILDYGAWELNPLVRSAIGLYGDRFWVWKFAIVSICLVLLCIHIKFKPTKTIIVTISSIYFGIVLYQIFLIIDKLKTPP